MPYVLMETKKKILSKVLIKLRPYRDLAEGILALVESSYVDEKTMDGIFEMVSLSLKTITDKKQKEKIRKYMEIITKIRTEEVSEKAEEDIDKILESI